MADSPLMTPGELMAYFGMKKSWFYRLQKCGHFRRLESKFQVGSRRYARVLVERAVNGESVSQFGRRTA